MRECKTPSGKGNSCRVLGRQHVLSKSFSTVVDSRNKTNTKKKQFPNVNLRICIICLGFLESKNLFLQAFSSVGSLIWLFFCHQLI